MNIPEVKLTQIPNEKTLQATNDLEASWSLYTVKKVRDVGSFFANRVRNCVIGCYLGFAELAVISFTITTVTILRGEPFENISGGVAGKVSPFNAAAGGAVEEIIFRGVLQNSIYAISSFIFNKLNVSNAENKAFWTALIPTATSFGLVHLTNPDPSLIQVAYCVGSGITSGYISHYNGLETAMWSHAASNYIAAGGFKPSQ